ncbi:MAG: homoserine dehydrogenase, partial [Butyrivibrio sp.]|nr:homoserine dehydrogenase [Butyrivibrio sp.]
MLGDVMFYGKGAGKNATASAVVADVIDITKHKGHHIEVNMKAENAKLSPKDNAVRSFFVRVPENKADEAKEIFGSKIEVIEGENVHGEFAFVTDMISEKDFEDRINKLDSVKGYIRLY